MTVPGAPMRTNRAVAALAGLGVLIPVMGGLSDGPAARPADARLAPYAPDPDHLWNQLHRALLVRTAPDGSRHVHSTDPLLYRGGKIGRASCRESVSVALV